MRNTSEYKMYIQYNSTTNYDLHAWTEFKHFRQNQQKLNTIDCVKVEFIAELLY